MAALAAADQPAGALDGVVLVNAPTELPSFAQDTAFGGVRRYLEKTLQPRQWQDSSPLHHADQLVHPLLVVVGTEDTMTPPDQGRRLAGATPASALLEVTGMGHHPTPGEWAQILEAADRQFDLGVRGHDVVDSGRGQRGRWSISAGGMRPMVVVVVHPHCQRLTPGRL